MSRAVQPGIRHGPVDSQVRETWHPSLIIVIAVEIQAERFEDTATCDTLEKKNSFELHQIERGQCELEWKRILESNSNNNFHVQSQRPTMTTSRVLALNHYIYSTLAMP
jgi:hypothetical protein